MCRNRDETVITRIRFTDTLPTFKNGEQLLGAASQAAQRPRHGGQLPGLHAGDPRLCQPGEPLQYGVASQPRRPRGVRRRRALLSTFPRTLHEQSVSVEQSMLCQGLLRSSGGLHGHVRGQCQSD
jgi:hypothetical protein